VDYERTALLLIAPDALARQLAEEVVLRIRDSGFRVVEHRLWTRPPERIEDFHRRNERVAENGQIFALVEKLFAFAPFVVAALEDAKPDGRSVHERLAELKGRGDPLFAAPGSLRHDLMSVNTVLNIVHSSDGPADTAREAAILLSSGERAPSEPGFTALLRSVRAAERGMTRESRLFPDVLGGVRARVLAGLWDELPVEARRRLDSWCARHGVRGLGGAAGGALLAELLPIGSHVDALIDSLAGGRPTEDIADLRRLGITLDPWEYLVLATSRFYAPTSFSDFDGARHHRVEAPGLIPSPPVADDRRYE
jgi:nucleoside diphosphate kinase